MQLNLLLGRSSDPRGSVFVARDWCAAHCVRMCSTLRRKSRNTARTPKLIALASLPCAEDWEKAFIEHDTIYTVQSRRDFCHRLQDHVVTALGTGSFLYDALMAKQSPCCSRLLSGP